jgi:ABC-type Fe3+ transport system permease subunit
MALLPRPRTSALPALLGLIAVAPMAAIVGAAVLDSGAESQLRVSLFPLALAALDPFVWTCFWNSLDAALAVAAVSLLSGLWLGQVIACNRFWGRPVLAALALGLAVAPAAFMALGLHGLFDPAGPWVWRGLSAALGRTPQASSGWSWRWMAWFWAASVQGTALVTVSTIWAEARLNPDWHDAARLAGAGRLRIWVSLTWPLLRPAVSGSLGLVFLLTLADPGAPLVLGLRRTLGFQLVHLATRPEPFPRLAAIALLTLTASLGCRGLLHRFWGDRVGTDSGGVETPRRPRSSNPPAWPRWLGKLLSVVIWVMLSTAPLVGLAVLALGGDSSLADRSATSGNGIAGPHPRLATEHVSTLVWTSALLGLSVAAICLVLSWWTPPLAAEPSQGRWRARIALLCGSIQPVISGVGVLALLRLVDLSVTALGSGPGGSRPAAWLEEVSSLLDPYRSPSLLLLLGVCLAHLPARVASSWVRSGRGTAARGIDQAVLAGTRGNRARRLAFREGSARAARRIVLWATLAVTSVSPAILLAPTIERGPLGSGIVRLTSSRATSSAAAAGLALLALAVNWTALAVAAAGRGPAHGRPLEIVELA